MKVICNECRNEFDWNDEDIFMIPLGIGFGSGDSKKFICRKDLVNEKKFFGGRETNVQPEAPILN